MGRKKVLHKKNIYARSHKWCNNDPVFSHFSQFVNNIKTHDSFTYTFHEETNEYFVMWKTFRVRITHLVDKKRVHITYYRLREAVNLQLRYEELTDVNSVLSYLHNQLTDPLAK